MSVTIDYDHIDECLKQLEATWERGADAHPPVDRLARLLNAATIEPTRSTLLKCLIGVDLELRRRRGLDPQPVDYIAVFPHETTIEATVQECFRTCAVPPPPPSEIVQLSNRGNCCVF